LGRPHGTPPRWYKLDLVRIRFREDTDVDRCLDVARAVHTRDGYPPRGPVDVDTFLAPSQELAAWVAERHSEIVGHAALHRAGAALVTVACATRHLGCSADDLAVVARVLVHPNARRTGVARALLDQAVGGAHARGLRPILDVATHFDAAIALYEQAGWKRVGTVTIEFAPLPDLDCHVYAGPCPPSPSAHEIARRAAAAAASESRDENGAR
jgi:GNAT superfamily N-acetyltransferase